MSTRPGVTGFILAGGKSVRMGRDKALLDWRGRPLVEHMAGLLSPVAVPVHVVGRAPLLDRVPGYGPLSGILTALETTETDANLIIAVDLPLLTTEFLNYLRSRAEISKSRLVACKIGSDFPLCLAMRRTLLPEVERRMAASDFSIHGLILDCDAEILAENELLGHGFTPEIFRNINTEKDYLAGL